MWVILIVIKVYQRVKTRNKVGDVDEICHKNVAAESKPDKVTSQTISNVQ